MKAFRIVLATRGATKAEAFSGMSGFSVDGRWHNRERYLDYAAENCSLATLERLVHYKRFDSLTPHLLYTLEIPDELIDTIKIAPHGWNNPVSFLPAAQALGNQWYHRAISPALLVPSAVTAGEHNLIVSSRHPAWRSEWVSGPSGFRFDSRLIEMAQGAARGD